MISVISNLLVPCRFVSRKPYFKVYYLAITYWRGQCKSRIDSAVKIGVWVSIHNEILVNYCADSNKMPVMTFLGLFI